MKYSISSVNDFLKVEIIYFILIYCLFTGEYALGVSEKPNLVPSQSNTSATANPLYTILQKGDNISVYRFGIEQSIKEIKLEKIYSIQINALGSFAYVISDGAPYEVVYKLPNFEEVISFPELAPELEERVQKTDWNWLDNQNMIGVYLFQHPPDEMKKLPASARDSQDIAVVDFSKIYLFHITKKQLKEVMVPKNLGIPAIFDLEEYLVGGFLKVGYEGNDGYWTTTWLKIDSHGTVALVEEPNIDKSDKRKNETSKSQQIEKKETSIIPNVGQAPQVITDHFMWLKQTKDLTTQIQRYEDFLVEWLPEEDGTFKNEEHKKLFIQAEEELEKLRQQLTEQKQTKKPKHPNHKKGQDNKEDNKTKTQ